MKFVVVGAGAIGAYVGASLARGGADVTLIARGAHLAQLQRNGVRILSEHEDFHVKPNATDDWHAIADADVVFLGLKAHSLPEVAPLIGRMLRPNAVVIAGQNGIPWWYFQTPGLPLAGTILESVDPGGVIGRSIPAEAVVGCVIYLSTEIVEPGVIRHIEGRRLSIGEPDGLRSERCAHISGALKAGGLKAPIESQLRNEIWLKLLGNATLNPASAMTRATLGELGSLPSMRATLTAACSEIALVAERLGVVLPLSIERRLEAGFAAGNHKTSMLQDLEHGRPLERGCLTGAIIELAQMLNIETPRMELIDACITALDQAALATRTRRDQERTAF